MPKNLGRNILRVMIKTPILITLMLIEGNILIIFPFLSLVIGSGLVTGTISKTF